MNLYSKKLNWKIALALLAFLIAGGFLWYSSYISGLTRFRNEQELEKWSLTIVKQAEVVKLTNQTFEQLKTEEQRKAKIWVRATKEFENDLPRAKAFLAGGGSLKAAPDLDPAQLAAYAAVASLILNLDESISKS